MGMTLRPAAWYGRKAGGKEKEGVSVYTVIVLPFSPRARRARGIRFFCKTGRRKG